MTDREEAVKALRDDKGFFRSFEHPTAQLEVSNTVYSHILLADSPAPRY